MISNKEIICPNNLLNVAHKKKGVKVGIVNAGKPLPMLSVQDAVNENLIEPIFIGKKDEILNCANEIGFDILDDFPEEPVNYHKNKANIGYTATVVLILFSVVVYDFVNKCGHITKPIIEIIILLLYLALDIADPSSPINRKSLLLLLIVSNIFPIPPCNFCTKYRPKIQAITNIKIA